MKKILLLLLFFVSAMIMSQEITKESIYGTWKVKKSLTKTVDPRLKDVVDGFSSSKYTFSENGDFEMKSNNKTKMFLMVSDKMKKAKWRFVKKKKAIEIGNKADGYSLMSFTVKQENGKTIFNLDESDISLEMKKMK